MKRPLLVALLSLCVLTLPATGRVLSYAPLSERLSVRSIHARNGRWFALIEALPGNFPYDRGQVVLYDTLGAEEPRVIYPADPNADAPIVFLALYERSEEGRGGELSVLIAVVTGYEHWWSAHREYFLSNDTGKTWKHVDGMGAQRPPSYQYANDFGGPYSGGLTPQVSVGGTLPFVIATVEGRVWGVTLDGKSRLLYTAPDAKQATLIGRNREGSRFIVRTGEKTLGVIGTQASSTPALIGAIPDGPATGWLTSNGSAYVQVLTGNGRILYLFHDGQREQITPEIELAFAVPTTNYDGAWMIRRQAGTTTLSRHIADGALETFWSDPSRPQVEALHTGANPDRLLIQVHRPSAQRERNFLDPAFAPWRVGDPAPASYDELFVNESPAKGLLHVDVDRVADGAPFYFDSGVAPAVVSIKAPAEQEAAGGADVGQEYGVVRASFRQRLVIPGVARQQGAFGSRWQTDVVLHNPLDAPQSVMLRLVPLGNELVHELRHVGAHTKEVDNAAPEVTAPQLTLAAHEIRVLEDVVKSIFGIDAGGGSLYIDPEIGVSATSRTFTRAGGGTFGLGMPAIDYYNAASSRFPAMFAGAFPGPGFRTNVLLTDTGRGSAVRLIGHGGSGRTGTDDIAFSATSNGVLQLSGVSTSLSATQGGLEIRPARGSVIPTVVAIDNLTNDPTWFPPDLPPFTVRTIPMVVHTPTFRTDLYLMNPAAYDNSVNFELKPWNSNDAPRRTRFNVGAGQTVVIRDAAMTLFGIGGPARLRYSSGIASEPGVRITSRVYAETANGGTYGSVLPPLNSFQSAAGGESLEILGVTGESDFRTSLALVDLNGTYDGRKAEARIRIFNQSGAEIGAFDIAFPIAGGMQIEDLFASRNLVPPKAALIRVDVKNGLIAAFATLTDNVTHDATYLAANLGGKAK